LTDVGGNTTLTGGQVGDTNDEAERRAREKGLASKHHFQSMDEIGETAISWTLGKMVIEASKAVPRSEIAPWDKARTGFERRLGAMGIEVIWAYAFIAFLLCTCFLAGVRKHRWALPSRRGYKPARTWRSEEDAEEGGKARVSSGPLRRWALRASRAVRWLPVLHKQKSERPRPTRMASMPNLSSSPPPSPKGYFFTPADTAGPSLHPSSSRASLTAGETRSRLSPGDTPRGLTSSGSASAVDIAGSTVPPPQTGSPPRSKTSSGRGKSRQGIHGHLSVLTTDPSSGGWNDPPVFNREPQHRGSLSVDREPTSGVLTPSAGANNGTALSRNSSRVNLNDLGLALRSSSRATTPFDNEA
jgi:Golgi apyrase